MVFHSVEGNTTILTEKAFKQFSHIRGVKDDHGAKQKNAYMSHNVKVILT